MPRNSYRRFPLLYVVAISVTVLLTAFGPTTARSSSPTGSTAVALPAYRVGTTFVYSNGTWETVTDVGSDRVTWKDHRGYISSGSPDFTRRRTSWQTRTRQGSRRFGPRTDIFLKGRDSIWPLRKGNAAKFTEAGSWIAKDGSRNTYTAQWTCKVRGTQQVAVPAGKFDAWGVECTRYRISKSRYRSSVQEVKMWYYAPEIEHFVLATTRSTRGKPSQRLELLAVVPPDTGLSQEAQGKLGQSFQQALENKLSGDPVPWSHPSAQESGETVAAGTFRLTDGTYCRRYVQRITRADDQRTYYGLACRTPRGRWYIPRR